MSRLNLNAINWANWKVIAREGRATVPLDLNPPQQLIRDRLQARSAAGRPMWAIILKGRRCGSSTYSEAIVTAHCIAFANARAMTIAHKGKNAKELFETARGFHQQFAGSIGQEFDHNVHELFFPHDDGISKHTLATAGTVEGGRGLMLSALLASECAFYENAQAVFTALESTVNPDPSTLMIYESTANGQVGDGQPFYEKWLEAQRGENDLEPIFISWLIDPGDTGRAVGYPGEVYGQPPYDADEKELIDGYGATPEQIAFRRWAIPNRCQSSPETFLQEYPHCPEVAFLTSGDPAFTADEFRMVERSVNSPKNRRIFVGHIDSNRDGEIVLREGRGGVGSLQLWERPRQGHFYYIGGDAARGLLSPDGTQRGDFSAAVGLNGSTGRQAFTYEAKIPVKDFAFQLNLLGHYFNKAKLNVEQTGGDGYYCTKELRDTYHYPNLMYWRSNDDKKRRSVTENPALMWQTTYKSRQRLIVLVREAIRTGEFMIFCKTVLNQMHNAMRDDMGNNWQIVRGHDDVFMAMALAVVCWQENPPPRIQGSMNLMDKADGDQSSLTFELEYMERLRQRARNILLGGTPQGKPDALQSI